MASHATFDCGMSMKAWIGVGSGDPQVWMMDGWTRVTHPFFSSTFCPLLWVWSSRSWSEGSALYRRCRVWIYIVIGEEHEERKGEREGGWEGQGVFFDLYYVVSILLVFLNVLILLYLPPS